MRLNSAVIFTNITSIYALIVLSVYGLLFYVAVAVNYGMIYEKLYKNSSLYTIN